MVTYRLEATVQRSTGYITDGGEKLIIPNKFEITRKRNKIIEKIIDQEHYQNVGGRNNVNMLESYRDIVYGTVVFNISGLPRNQCDTFRSISKIKNGEILQSKLEKFAILRYKKGEEEVAVTLNKHTQICGKRMYETGINNIFVVLVSDEEEFLDNKKLKMSEYNTDVIYEAELRGALNSLELSTDNLYRDINYCICLLQRQQILTTQSMLQH